MKKPLLTITFCLLACTCSASQWQNDSYRMQEVQTNVERLRIQLSNLETEFHMLQERIENQGQITDTLHKHLQEEQSEISAIKSSVDNKNEDEIRKIREHAKVLSYAVKEQGDKVAQLEKHLERNSNNLTNIQSAVESILEALQIKTPTPVAKGGETYQVQKGDSIEKIAKRYKITPEKLQTYNNLKNDRINVGQKLQIPQ